MSSPGAEPSIFSRIVAREIPATIVAENDHLIAFEDIAPQAPVHIVITTKTAEYANVVELAAGDPTLLAELVRMASTIADERTQGEFRLVFNSGAAAGQTVFHVHAHVMGVRDDSATLGEGSLGSL
ncbi:HIT domain-containing protein [Cryobacterium sp. CG_9.6]|uniref:HIT domain-containing protein n=1 Tax=Cryobacterium sp. CG_9.6 TaxID=2760710 RepID=UPI0024731EB5|nr:HIT domain-containing protein [Cryobacterium sp. CG_9.6]MDH6237175.1 histidine triad (HIT) family protein [Cryobacterium sp. CG_9.6]